MSADADRSPGPDHDRGHAAAQERFPRGLAQPDSFRFSVDSLLLASFAARAMVPSKRDRGRTLRGADLGAGCGVVALGLLLARTGDDLHVTGVEKDGELWRCAQENRGLLGLEKQFDVINDDVSSYECAQPLDFVITNPPYRLPGTGRQSQDRARNRARFESGAGLDGFLAAAARCLRTKAPLFLVHLAEDLDRVLRTAHRHGLAPARVLPVHPRAGVPARLILLEARLGGGPGLVLEPGLVLYRDPADHGANKAPGRPLTRAALAFCPFLECNAA